MRLVWCIFFCFQVPWHCIVANLQTAKSGTQTSHAHPWKQLNISKYGCGRNFDRAFFMNSSPNVINQTKYNSDIQRAGHVCYSKVHDRYTNHKMFILACLLIYEGLVKNLGQAPFCPGQGVKFQDCPGILGRLATMAL